MRADVLAIGTELLLGQIVDTNSSWIGEQLAAVGIDTMEHRKVGDNLARMVASIREMLEHADAVVVCGGIGPTQDDVTRDAIAEVLGVELERREELVEYIASLFGTRGRDMPQNNLRQADVPKGADVIPNPIGTAPGIRAEVDGKVIYAVPGVPYEMQLMVKDHVLPDLLARSGEAAVIVSRSLKTWGASESGLAEMIAHEVDTQVNPTIAFLARGIEGIVVRLTAKAATAEDAWALIEPVEARLRDILGDLVFAVDDETMEHAVLTRLEARGWTLGVAESLTGGLIGARIANVPGASRTFQGSIASYATDVKRSVLGVTAAKVVSQESAEQMAVGAQRVLGADVGIAATGVAGPEEQDGQPVGTVWFAIALPGVPVEAMSTRLPGDRERIRQFSTISLLNILRMRLDQLPLTVLKRAFLAIVPPVEVLDAIDRLLERPKSSRFAWTRRDQWHVTVQYYGRIGDVEGLLDGVRAATAAWDPIALQVQGGGAFPNPTNARVFWLGVGSADALRDLHATIAAATRSFIDRRDRIDLIPHITMARVKRSTDLTDDVDALAGVVVGVPWTCTELLLLESESGREGSVYVEQDRFALGG